MAREPASSEERLDGEDPLLLQDAALFAAGQAQGALWKLRLHPKLLMTGGQASAV